MGCGWIARRSEAKRFPGSSPRRRGPIPSELKLIFGGAIMVGTRRMGPRLRGDDRLASGSAQQRAKTPRLVAAFLGALLVSTATAPSARAQTNEPLTFANKQIRQMVGFSATGFGYDTYGRLLARYLPKYLPGNPTVVPSNRPGAGSLNLANYLFNAAPKDGTE